MKLIIRSVLLLGVFVITTQDIAGRKGCDCSICKGVDNKINPIVGKHAGDGKSGCSLCEQRKEMLRLEKERQRQLQKCPFEILGAPPEKGKDSEEIFDDFRELLVPSQNGFFDMMRGVVRTMHVSSVAELNWAKEKEAQELAKKKLQEAEEAKKRKAAKQADEIVSLSNPIPPKVTVVVKQTPCGQVIQPSEPSEPEKMSLMQTFPSETNSEEVFRPLEVERSNLQSVDQDYLELTSKENILYSDLIDQLTAYNTLPTTPPRNAEEVPETGIPEIEEETMTESPFLRFINLSRGGNSLSDFDTTAGLPSGTGVALQVVEKENAEVGHSIEPMLQ